MAAITLSPIALTPPAENVQANRQTPTATELTARVAKEILLHTAYALLLVGLAYPFTASVAIPTLVSSLVYSLAASLLFKSLSAICIYANQRGSIVHLESWGFDLLSFATIDLFVRQTLVHEMGHYTAASLLYVDANPHISLLPGVGGNTTAYLGELSPLGELLGSKVSKILFHAGGPLFGTALAIADLYAAYRLQSSHPEISGRLVACALINVVYHTSYALSAFSSSAKGHDFCRLAALGVHPVAAAVCIVAVPLLFTLALKQIRSPSLLVHSPL